MRAIWAMAIKDLVVLIRDKAGFFFVFVFPVLFGILFGLIMSAQGGGNEPRGVGLVIVDQDQSEASARLIGLLESNERVAITTIEEFEEARARVAAGNAEPAMLVIPEAFGERVEGMFFDGTAEIELIMDPARAMERGVVQGAVTSAAYAAMFDSFTDQETARRTLARAKQSLGDIEDLNPADRLVFSTFLNGFEGLVNRMDELPDASSASDGSEDSSQDESATTAAGPAFEPVRVAVTSITDLAPEGAETLPKRKRVSAFAITFPQAVAWGLLGCVIGFGASLVEERKQGTMRRLALSPMRRSGVLAGKALGSLLVCTSAQVVILLIGVIAFGVRPNSWPLLAVAVISSSIGFVGLAMLLASLFKSQAAAEGVSRAALILLALVGGAGIPLAFMPEIVREFASVSPFKWAIMALEGAIWRDAGLGTVLSSSAILVVGGVVFFTIGAAMFRMER